MNIAYKLIKIADKILNILIYLFLCIVFLFCLYALFDTIKVYVRASSQSVSVLKPTKEDPINSLKSLQKINEDVVGWITIDGTKIDYPVVVGESNEEYLSKDVYGNYSLAGSLFLDYRNSRKFDDIYSVIFGHHMNGGTMFGNIQKFIDREYFERNKTGTLYTERGVYNLEVIAYISTDAYDSAIYSINKDDLEQQNKLVEYIKRKAVNYRQVGLTKYDKIICLSTCSTATTNGRDILMVKVVGGGD